MSTGLFGRARRSCGAKSEITVLRLRLITTTVRPHMRTPTHSSCITSCSDARTSRPSWNNALHWRKYTRQGELIIPPPIGPTSASGGSRTGLKLDNFLTNFEIFRDFIEKPSWIHFFIKQPYLYIFMQEWKKWFVLIYFYCLYLHTLFVCFA